MHAGLTGLHESVIAQSKRKKYRINQSGTKEFIDIRVPIQSKNPLGGAEVRDSSDKFKKYLSSNNVSVT